MKRHFVQAARRVRPAHHHPPAGARTSVRQIEATPPPARAADRRRRHADCEAARPTARCSAGQPILVRLQLSCRSQSSTSGRGDGDAERAPAGGHVHGQPARRRHQQPPTRRLRRGGLGPRRDPGVELHGARTPTSRSPTTKSDTKAVVPVAFFAPQRERLRRDARAPPARARRRDEGAHPRLPRLLRPDRPADAEDGRHRPPLHARRSRPAARPGAAPADRRRSPRRQQAAAAEPGIRCASVSSPASAARRGTTSRTSCAAAASGSG